MGSVLALWYFRGRELLRLVRAAGLHAALEPVGPVARSATLMADSQDANHVRCDHVVEVVGEPTKDLASDAPLVDHRRGFRMSKDEPDCPTDFCLKAPSD